MIKKIRLQQRKTGIMQSPEEKVVKREKTNQRALVII